MPQISATSNRSTEAERKIKAKKKKLVRAKTTRPAPKSQPGPYTDAERKEVEKHKAKPSYGKALGEARTHGSQGRRGTSPAPDSHDSERGRKTSDAAIRKARVKYLRRTRDTGTDALTALLDALAPDVSPRELATDPTGGRSRTIARVVRPEIEGRGKLAAGLERLGSAYAGENRKAVPGSPGSPRLASTGAVGFSERAAKDALNLPGQAIPSIYVPVASAVEAAQGRPERGKELLKTLDETDPVWNLIVAGVEAVQGDSPAAKKRLKRAKDAASEHPGFTAAEAFGVKSIVGRTTGRVIRQTGRTVTAAGEKTGSKRVEGAGRKIRKVAGTERAPRTLEGTSLEEHRTYSPDVIDKAFQVAGEKIQGGRTGRKRRKADRVAAVDPDRAAELRATANRMDPHRVKDSGVRRRVDERVAANEGVRRIHRPETVKAVEDILRPLRKSEKPIVVLVAQRVVEADRTDLRSYVRELDAESSALTGAKLRENRTQARLVNRVLDDDDADLARVEQAAAEYRDIAQPLQDELVDAGMLDRDQADRAAVIPYAVRNMGAKHDKDALNAAAKVARDEFKDADRNYRKAVAAREQLKGRQRARRGAAGAREAARDSADAKVKAAQQGRDAAERRLRDARELAASDPLLGPDGQPLPTEAIVRHMQDNGVDSAAYVTQAPNQRGARNFNIRAERAQTLRTRRRTGESSRQGTYDIHQDVLREGAARARGLVDAVNGWTGFIDEFGLRHPDSGEVLAVRSYDKARAVANDLNEPGQRGWTVVRVAPWGARREQIRRMLDETDPEQTLDNVGGQDSPLVESMRDALNGSEGEGPWAIVPDVAADQLRRHLNTMGGGAGGKVWTQYTQMFRNTVLATNPKWLAGNVTEATLRAALAKAGPRSWITGRRVMRRLDELDPEAAEATRVRNLGGGQFGFAQRTRVHKAAESYRGTSLEGVANALGKFWRTPGPRHTAGLWHAWTDFVFSAVNHGIEVQFQSAMLGKSLRDSELMNDRFLKLSERAIDDAAKGLTNTNAQAAFGREVDLMFGKYGKYSPQMRLVVANYTPFLAWALNAAYFVLRTMPIHHPVATAVLASMVNATEDWRKDHGLDLFMEGAVPSWLQGSIPIKGKGMLRTGAFTPFGLAGDPLGIMSGQVLPQFEGALMAMKGLSWTGDKLRNDDGSEFTVAQRLVEAAHQAALAAVPLAGQGERVAKGGVLDTLNPARITSPTKKRGVVRRRRPKDRPFFDGGGVPTRDDGKFFDSPSSGGGGGGFFDQGG